MAKRITATPLPDYYELLNVGKDFNDKEIKNKYHTLALSCHPDKNSNAHWATKQFQEVSTLPLFPIHYRCSNSNSYKMHTIP